MEPRAVADAVQTGEENVVMEALLAYNQENSQSFTFDDAQQEDRKLFQELRGVHLLTDALELTLGMSPEESPPALLPPQETERAMEILKVLFNITFDSIKREVDQEDAALYQHLGTLLRHCVMITAAGDRTEEFHGHTVNLLGNLPLKCLDVLLTLEPHEGSLEFLGVNMDVIRVLLSFLEKRLHQTHRLKESVAPVLSVLTECARMHRPARKFLKAQVLPPLRDVRTRPEVGELLRNKLVRLMTHLDTDVKRVAAEFLFVLCSESVPRFIKYTGYGNAAGLLAARGLMAGGRPEGQYSEDEDTDTDEYKEAKARCGVCPPPPSGSPQFAPIPVPTLSGPVGWVGQDDKCIRLLGISCLFLHDVCRAVRCFVETAEAEGAWQSGTRDRSWLPAGPGGKSICAVASPLPAPRRVGFLPVQAQAGRCGTPPTPGSPPPVLESH
ncbi:synembryn-A isoform X3 [Diceros bicornis minor]|uniref:synembryn-A isoform X3 n=1 Tax=Diceros bicornis minor TaxID=77932 RepID=UPI0026EA92A3|nr:synembryn-A isoform X3 [Diceros bicornis minor]